MLRSALSKVMWVGRATVFLVGLAVMLALVLGVATTALAVVPGDPFRLGQTNGIDAMSTLVGNVAGTMLRVDNNSTGAGATALELRVEEGKAPMKVNSATRVALLNADKVDGKDATAFYAAGSKVADSSHADQADSATSAQNAANADKLDGKDSAQFFQGAGQTVDGRATMSSDSTAPVTNIPSFGSISVVRQFAAPGNDCRAVFRNESGGQLFRLGIRDNSGTVSSGVGDVDPSFGNGGEIELAGSDARPRSGFGTWQIVTPDMGKVLTLTVSAHFGVPGAQNTECEVAVQGAYREH
jgi:hypothetical protein